MGFIETLILAIALLVGGPAEPSKPKPTGTTFSEPPLKDYPPNPR